MRAIKNFDCLATNALRRDALLIAEAGYAAIDTERVLRALIVLDGRKLSVGGAVYDLDQFSRIKVMGFGKASCKAMQTIESILWLNISEGIAIDVRAGVCDIIAVKEGTHPRPSVGNVELSRGVVTMAKSTEKDLVIVAVSGGGSALLCWPLEECEQGSRLYDDFLRVGASIDEMNTVRKHISSVKGGGLAALLYPATVIGLIFCDVPGDHFEDVASGPTYFDAATKEDAQNVLDRYGLMDYTLNETPKDRKFFEKVNNVPVVSNRIALGAMDAKARALDYVVANVGDALYDECAKLVERMRDGAEAKKATCAIAGGEPKLMVTQKGGKGGRCQYASLEALKQIKDGEVFLALASDGRDNSDSAGAIADSGTRKCADEQGVSIDAHLANFNTYAFFEQTGDLIFTGETDANVSDLFVYLRSA